MHRYIILVRDRDRVLHGHDQHDHVHNRRVHVLVHVLGSSCSGGAFVV